MFKVASINDGPKAYAIALSSGQVYVQRKKQEKDSDPEMNPREELVLSLAEDHQTLVKELKERLTMAKEVKDAHQALARMQELIYKLHKGVFIGSDDLNVVKAMCLEFETDEDGED